MPRRGLLTYRAVADMLDCSEDTVRRLVQKELLPQPGKYDGLGVRFRVEDIEHYIVEQEVLRRLRQEQKARSTKTQGDANSSSEQDS